MTAVKIPHEQLSPEALRGVVEEFVTRDGTDYGEVEVSLDSKMAQILRQLNAKEVFIVFDDQSETSTILHRDDPNFKKIRS